MTFPSTTIGLTCCFAALTGTFLLAVPAAHASPTRLWSTYYGGESDEGIYGLDLDGDDGVVVVGVGDSTTGVAGNAVGYTTFDSSYGGAADGYVARFDAAGDRLWSTYFGGDDLDTLRAVAVDGDDNIIAVGVTQSASGLATVGDTTLSGGSDAVLVKFAPDGTRTWATYFGGNDVETGFGVCVSPTGAIFIVGSTKSTTGVAFNAATQSTLVGTSNAFIARFEDDGTLTWATYYGGAVTQAQACAVDPKEYLWVTGTTTSTTNIALDGWDNTHNGSTDAFVALFDQDGELVRGSYYGGSDFESGYGITVDPESSGAVYVAGYTDSENTGDVIADDGTSLTGFRDGFVARFNVTLDDRVWGTYFGGENGEVFYDIEYDGEGLVLSGYTDSTTGVATLDGHQTVAGGDYDGMFVAMDASDGSPYYATYIGGGDIDQSFGVAGNFATAAVATADQSGGLASVGAWDAIFDGDLDGLISYFQMYTP